MNIISNIRSNQIRAINYNITYKDDYYLNILLAITVFQFIISTVSGYYPIYLDQNFYLGVTVKINYLIIIILPIWCFLLLSKSDHRSSRINKSLIKQIVIVSILYSGFAVIQLFVNSDSSSLFKLRRLLVAVIPNSALVLLIFYYSINSSRRRLKIFRLLYIITIIITVYSYFIGSKGMVRDTGIVNQANDLGSYGALCLVLSFIGIMDYLKLFTYKVLYIPVITLSFLIVLFSGSYTAFALATVSLIILIGRRMFYEKGLTLNYFYIIIIVTILVFTVNSINIYDLDYKSRNLLGAIYKQNDVQQVVNESTYDKRNELMYYGFIEIWNKPFFGNGLDRKSIDLLISSQSLIPHNAFITAALTLGIVPVIFILILFWTLYKNVILIKLESQKSVALVLLAFVFLSDNTSTFFSFWRTGSARLICFIFLLTLISSDKSYSLPKRFRFNRKSMKKFVSQDNR